MTKNEWIKELTACGMRCRWRSTKGRKTVWRSRETRTHADEIGLVYPGVVVRIERYEPSRPGGHERWVVTRSVSIRGADQLLAIKRGAVTTVRHAHFQFVGEGRSFEDAEYECVAAEEWLQDARSEDE